MGRLLVDLKSTTIVFSNLDGFEMTSNIRDSSLLGSSKAR